jgi:peptide/nickel transport system ATP-binding protein
LVELPVQKVGEALVKGPVSLGMDRKAAVEKARGLLDRVGLGGGAYDRRPEASSGGEKQRIAIARALMHDPVLLVADEPVSALDVTVQASVLDLLEEIRRERDLAMLFITHDLRVAGRISDQMIILKEGEKIEFGETHRMLKEPQHRYTRSLLAAVPGLNARTHLRRHSELRQEPTLK